MPASAVFVERTAVRAAVARAAAVRAAAVRAAVARAVSALCRIALVIAGSAALVLVAPLAGAASAAGAPTPSPAPDATSIEVDPSTVEAGDAVIIRANCPDDTKPATVRSDAFGQVTIKPDGGVLTATVTVPENQDPRSFTVRLTCSGGETATATLHVVARTRPSQGPATGFGGTAGGGSGGLLIGGGLLAVAGGLAIGLLTARRRRSLG